MDATLDLGEVGVKPPRGIQWAKTAAQLVTAFVLLTGGVVYTVYQEHPMWREPVKESVVAMPGAVIKAPKPLSDVQRVAAVLKKHARYPESTHRIASAIVHEGRRRNLDPALLVAVLLTEDETLDTMARSHVGARGLMQVMPFHSGKWGCRSPNLFGIESNICHGASVLQDAVKYAPSIRVALLRYNGCVSGANTPNCHTYPDRVIRVANRTSKQMLALGPAS